jgi:NodT family efflux transporter outer membrane factor (OMF) lipoprotein
MRAGSLLTIRGAALFLAVSALAMGCRVKAPPKPVAIQQDGMPHIALPSAWGAPGAAPTQNWLLTFNDNQLNILVTEALAYNPDLAVAASRVEQARLYAKQAGAALWPSVSGMARGGGQMSDGSGLTGGAISATWELDLWGRVRYARAAAAAGASSTEADFRFAQQAVAATVAKCWILAVEARLQLTVAQDLLATSEQLVQLAETRVRVGVGDDMDAAVARSDAGAYRDTVRRLELARNQADRALEVVVGRYPSGTLETGTEFPAFPGDLPAGLPSELLERRPDVIAAERRVAAAFNLVGEAKAARLPKIALTMGVNSISSDLFLLADRDNPVWSAGANLLMPLFTGGALKRQVEIRKEEQREAVAHYASIGLRAFADVEEAMASELAMRDRERILTAQLVDSQHAVDLARTRFNVGSGDLRAVEQRQLALTANRSALLRMQAEQRVQRINLHLALGGSFVLPPIQD